MVEYVSAFITRFLIVVLGGPVNWLAGIEHYDYQSFLFWDVAGQSLCVNCAPLSSCPVTHTAQAKSSASWILRLTNSSTFDYTSPVICFGSKQCEMFQSETLDQYFILLFVLNLLIL